MIIIEDGSIVEDANSLVTIQEYRDYFMLIGEIITETDQEIEALLIKGMRYIDGYYSDKIIGQIVYMSQSLIFPRYDCYYYGRYYSEDIHPNWKKAQMEAGILTKTYNLSPTIEKNVRITKVRKKAKYLEKELEYDDNYSSKTNSYTSVDRLMLPFKKSNHACNLQR